MTKINLKETMEQLEEIANWFEGQEEVDVEEGLIKVKEGAQLIKQSKTRLKDIENEFNEVKNDLGTKKDSSIVSI